jgi:hypothetical protein
MSSHVASARQERSRPWPDPARVGIAVLRGWLALAKSAVSQVRWRGRARCGCGATSIGLPNKSAHELESESTCFREISRAFYGHTSAFARKASDLAPAIVSTKGAELAGRIGNREKSVRIEIHGAHGKPPRGIRILVDAARGSPVQSGGLRRTMDLHRTRVFGL